MRIACLTLLACSLLACDATAPGEVILALTWNDRPDTAVWLSARVEDQDARILAESPQVEVLPGAPVELLMPRVPNGTGRVVRIAGRDNPDDVLARYGGESEPFDVTPGETLVDVAISLLPVDRPENENAARLCFAGECDATLVLPAQLRQAEIHTTTRNIAAVRVANDPSFTGVAAGRFAMDGEHCETRDQQTRCVIPWDLTRGILAEVDGQYAVHVRFQDTAGFDLRPQSFPVIRDGSPPLLLRTSVSPDVVQPGESASVVLSVSEPIDVARTQLTADGAQVGALSRIAESLEYSAEITATGQASEVRLSATLVDVLGNRAALLAIEQGVRVDADAPRFMTWQVDPLRLDPAADQTLTVRFAVDEENPIPAHPSVRFGGAAFIIEPDGEGWRGTLDVAALDLQGTQAALPVEASWTDRAGNAARVEFGRVEVDYRPPSAQSLTVRPAVAIAGQPMTLEVVADEPLARASLVDPPAGFPVEGTLSPDGRVARWTAVEGEEGVFELTAELVDLVGQRAMVGPVRGARDLTPIALEDAVTLTVERDGQDRTPFARQGAVVAVALALDADDVDAVSATLSGVEMARVAPDRFEFTVAADTAEGPHPILVTATDLAGNSSQWGGSITVDRTPPTANTNRLLWEDRPDFLPEQFIDLVFAPAGAMVTVIIRADEPVEAWVHFDQRESIRAGQPENGVMRVPVAAHPDQRVEAVAIELIDRAGNVTFVETGEIDWDYTPPAPIADLLRVTRAPWGCEASENERRTWITASDALPDGTTVVIVPADAEGRCDVETHLIVENEDAVGALARGVLGDVLYACAIAYDRAGNASPPAFIRRGTWIATLGGEIPGNASSNPHTLVATPWEDPWRIPDRGTPVGPAAARLDAEMAEASGAWAWWRVGGETPPPSTDHLVVDPHRGRLLVITETDDGVLVPASLRLAERGWSSFPARGEAPSARRGAAVIYDRRRDRLLLLGGLDARDVRAWSAESERWSTRGGDICSGGGGVVYDPLRDQFVLHGGYCEEEGAGTTLWDPEREVSESVEGEQPSGRGGHAMAWDPVDGVVLLYGGRAPFTIESLADLWAWDGARWTLWEADAPGGPGRRDGQRMAWDQRGNQLILYGGEVGEDPCLPVWTRTRGAAGVWTAHQPEPPCPAAGPMVWVDALERVVVRDAAGLWTWEGARWQRLTPVFDQRPPAGHSTMAWDPDANRIYLAASQALFALDQSVGVWTSVGALPEPGQIEWSAHHGLILEGQEQRYRHIAADEWAPLDLADGPAVDPTGQLVRQAGFGLLHLSADAGETVIASLADTWSTLTRGDGPRPTAGTAAAWLNPAAQLIAVGLDAPDGAERDPRTWTWTRADGWAPVVGPGPSYRAGARLTFNNERERMMLFGGQETRPGIGGGLIPIFDALWAWDGAGWHVPPRTTPWPTARHSHGFAFDRNNSRLRLLMFGGEGVGGGLNDYWEGAMASGRPALRFDLNLAAAELPPDTIERLQVRAVVGGESPAANLDRGVRMRVWDGEDWVQTASINARIDAPRMLTWAQADIAALLRGSVTAEQTVSVSLTPRGDNNGGRARVALDYIEAQVDYMLP